MDLTDLFPAEAYAFRLGLRRGDGAAYFGRKAETHILAERHHWLTQDPARYLAVEPRAEALVDELMALFAEWQLLASPIPADTPRERLRELSDRFDPDLVLLAPSAYTGEMEVVGGALCFPTAWRLTDKLGHPMFAVHAPVPGLNQSLGQQIATTLAKLRPGAGLLRANWSLTATPELNQHPDRLLPRLDEASTLANTWLRAERQALFALPKSGGVLFAIRIESETLAAIKQRSPPEAKLLAQALQSMPAEVAAYKGLAPARPSMIAQLMA
jgi:hypothetical protein